MKKALLILPVLAVLAACERSFDISKQLGDGLVWMSFIPSNDYDTTFFIVQGTTPLVGYPEPRKTSGETISVTVNGRPLELEKSERSVPDKMQFYATEHVFEPGDLIEAGASLPGMAPVSASCEMPGNFPDYTWKLRRPKASQDRWALYADIDYADPKDEGGFYGAAIVQECAIDGQLAEWDPENGEWVWGEVTHDVLTTWLRPSALTDIGSLSASSEDPVIVTPDIYNYMSGYFEEMHPVQIWKDMPGYAGADGRRSLTLAATFHEGSKRFDIEVPGEYARWQERHYTYRIVLYRFSESFYNYLKAQYNNNGSEFFELGLAPVSYVYTNVRGGAGICGAYTVVSSNPLELG